MMGSRILRTIACAGLALSAWAGAQRVEPDSPQFEGIELRLLQDNYLTREYIDVEGLRLNLYGGAMAVADDNLYSQTEDAEKDDTYYVGMLGGTLVYDRGGDFSLSLDGVYYKFGNPLDYEEYDVNGKVALAVSEQATVTLALSRAHDIGAVDPDQKFGPLADIESDTDTASAQLDVNLTSRTSLTLGAGASETDYDSMLQHDSETVDARAMLAHVLNMKTRVSAELRAGQTDFDGHTDSDMYEANVGASYLLTDKITASARLGYLDRQYDKDQGGGDYGDPVVSLGLKYVPMSNWEHSVTAVHTALNSQSSNYYEYQRVAYDAVYTPMAKLKLAGGLYVDFVDPSDATEQSDRLGGKLSATYAVSEFVTVGASYKYTDKSSDEPTFEYTRNLASLGMWLTF